MIKKPWMDIVWFTVWGVFQAYAIFPVLEGLEDLAFDTAFLLINTLALWQIIRQTRIYTQQCAAVNTVTSKPCH